MASVSDPGYDLFEVEQILHKGKTMYRIGYDNTENTWEPSSNLYCKDLLKDFNKRFRQSGLQVQQLTDADVPNPQTAIPHTNKVIDIDTIDDDVVEKQPPNQFLLEAQFRWFHTQGINLGMTLAEEAVAAASAGPPMGDVRQATVDGPNSVQMLTVAVIPAAATAEPPIVTVISAAATAEPSVMAVIPAAATAEAPVAGNPAAATAEPPVVAVIPAAATTEPPVAGNQAVATEERPLSGNPAAAIAERPVVGNPA